MTKPKARKRTRKTPAKTPVAVKRPQPHGGALLVGNPGNVGGGRPPSAIRAAARAKLDQRLDVLDEIAGRGTLDAEAGLFPAKDSDRIAAVKALADIGLTDSIAVTDVRKALDETGELLRDRLTPEVAEPIIEELRVIWMRL